MEPNDKIATIQKRFIAIIIDLFVAIFLNYIISAFVLKPFGGLSGAMGVKDFQFGEDLVKGAYTGFTAFFVLFLMFIGVLIITFLYDFLMVASPFHATFGKILMRIKVVSSDGYSIGILVAFMRSLLKFISVCFWFIPWLVALFTKKRQALHDLITSSIVIDIG